MGIFVGTIVGIMIIAVSDWFHQIHEAKKWEEAIPPWAEDMPGRAFFSR